MAFQLPGEGGSESPHVLTTEIVSLLAARDFRHGIMAFCRIPAAPVIDNNYKWRAGHATRKQNKNSLRYEQHKPKTKQRNKQNRAKQTHKHKIVDYIRLWMNFHMCAYTTSMENSQYSQHYTVFAYVVHETQYIQYSNTTKRAMLQKSNSVLGMSSPVHAQLLLGEPLLHARKEKRHHAGAIRTGHAGAHHQLLLL